MSKPVCGICGAPASRRLDLSLFDRDSFAAEGWNALTTARGALLCISCADTKPLGELAQYISAQTTIVKGCLVQCANNPPRHLRWTRTAMARPWRKTVCPNCHGRAQVRWLGNSVKIHRRLDWRGAFRQIADILSPREREQLEQAPHHDEVDADTGGTRHESGGIIIGGRGGPSA